MKRITINVLITLILFNLVGCAKISKNSTYKNQKTMGFPFTVDNVEITKCPKKVISLSPAITEIIYEIGQSDKLVGRSVYCKEPDNEQKIPTVGSPANPDIEEITKIKPEFVLTQSPISQMEEESLKKIGVQVINIPVVKTIFDLADEYAAISKIFLGSNEGDVVTRIKLEPLDSKVIEINNKKYSKKIVFIATELMAIATGDTFSGNIIDFFGENIAKDYTGYAMPTQDIIKAKPEIIFISSEIKEDQLPKDIKTYINAGNVEVIKINGMVFEKPSFDIIDEMNKILEKMTQLDDKNDGSKQSD